MSFMEIALFTMENGEMTQTTPDRLPYTEENEFMALQQQSLHHSMGEKAWIIYFNTNKK